MSLIKKTFKTNHYLIYLLLFIFLVSTNISHAENKTLIRSVDFSQQPDGDARAWLLERGYLLKLDADEFDLKFKNGQLNIKTSDSKASLFVLKLKPENYIANVSSIEMEWGVIKHPDGANWEEGNNRVALAFMFFFGTEKISSGLPFQINSAPYFISPFIGSKEQKGKTYTGKLYKKGGRYICVATTNGSNKLIKSNIEVNPEYMNLFNKDKIPPITGIAFQMNTSDTEGGAHAFIQKLNFYSSK